MNKISNKISNILNIFFVLRISFNILGPKKILGGLWNRTLLGYKTWFSGSNASFPNGTSNPLCRTWTQSIANESNKTSAKKTINILLFHQITFLLFFEIFSNSLVTYCKDAQHPIYSASWSEEENWITYWMQIYRKQFHAFLVLVTLILGGQTRQLQYLKIRSTLYML